MKRRSGSTSCFRASSAERLPSPLPVGPQRLRRRLRERVVDHALEFHVGFDEAALADAIREGRVAGAGIDVFAKEPCTDSPLFEFEQVVVTPHLGASTDEAQEKAGIAVAKSVRLALAGELVPDAVNVQGGVLAPIVKPYLPLAEKLGRIAAALTDTPVTRIDVEVYGALSTEDVRVLELSALKGAFESLVEDPVSYVNAPLLATERGVETGLTTSPDSDDHRSMIRVVASTTAGTRISIAGTTD